MIPRHDDPLVAALAALGEPVYTLDSNLTAERIARLIFDVARQQGLSVSRVAVWETPTSSGRIPRLVAFDLDGTLIDSSATSPSRSRRWSKNAADARSAFRSGRDDRRGGRTAGAARTGSGGIAA